MPDGIMSPMEELGYTKSYDFTQYSHDNNVNVIPEKSFKHLIEETFRIIADILRNTYGPYGSLVVISDQSETTTTKDGYNVFNAVGFSHTYKRLVYLAIKKIIDRVNNNVGDGTTSCILLAEKMFREIEKTLKTVDDKRNILSVLTNYEQMLQNSSTVRTDIDEGTVIPLTADALDGLIDMAGNYDPELTSVIKTALDPQVDQNGVVQSVRNVIVEPKLEHDGELGMSYGIDYLPGDYRVRVFMDQEIVYDFEEPTEVRIALYDHAFTQTDWEFFMKNYDKKTKTIIIARSFGAQWEDAVYGRYLRDMQSLKMRPTIVLATIKGEFVRDEINDLAAVLNFEPIALHSKEVDHDRLPKVKIQIHNGNCMCFNMEEVPTHYIESLKNEMNADLSKSMIKHQLYKDRIRALSNISKDTMITVKASSSLELKMLSDKIDDCLSIVNSAIEYGIVPNMFVYGYWRIMCYKHQLSDQDDMAKNVANAIMDSIKGLFGDIWISKHGDELESKRDAIIKDLYQKPEYSFDIIKESMVPIQSLPTSAQYDLEVIAASISIVKYLLTSRALIFDAHIMKPVDDTGRYMPMQ